MSHQANRRAKFDIVCHFREDHPVTPSLSDQGSRSSARRTLRGLGAIAALVDAPTLRLCPARTRLLPRSAVGVSVLLTSPTPPAGRRPSPFVAPAPRAPPPPAPGRPPPNPAARVAIAPAPARGAPHVDAWLVAPDTAPKRVADTRRQPMRLSALFEEFCDYLRVEKEAAPRTIETYRWCFRDYESFVMKQIGGTVLVSHFTAETCRAYQYDLAARGLQTSSIRVRLATLGSLGKWALRRDKLARNPVDVLTRPRRKARLPRVPRWETVASVLQQCTDPREKALVALMCVGALRRSEIIALDVRDVAPGLGLRRVPCEGRGPTTLPPPQTL